MNDLTDVNYLLKWSKIRISSSWLKELRETFATPILVIDRFMRFLRFS